MPPQTPPTQPGLLRGVLTVSGSQPGLQHCGSCTTSHGQGRGLRPALRCHSAFCQQLGCTQAQHRPAPLGPATCRTALSPWVTHGGGAGCWHVLMFPSTSRVITSHELSQRNEASAACCRTKLWFQQGAGQSLQLAAGPPCASPNPPGSAWPTSQLCLGTPFHFDLALSDPGFSKNHKQECGCCSDRRETRRPLLPPSPLTLYRKNWLQTSSRHPRHRFCAGTGGRAGGTSSPRCCWGPAGQPRAVPPPFCARTPRPGTALWDKSCARSIASRPGGAAPAARAASSLLSPDPAPTKDTFLGRRCHPAAGCLIPCVTTPCTAASECPTAPQSWCRSSGTGGTLGSSDMSRHGLWVLASNCFHLKKKIY